MGNTPLATPGAVTSGPRTLVDFRAPRRLELSSFSTRIEGGRSPHNLAVDLVDARAVDSAPS